MHYVFGKGMTGVVNVQPVWFFSTWYVRFVNMWKIPHVCGKIHT